MMYGSGKSDSAIVAMKPTNNADPSAAESVEPRAGTKGNADQQNTRRAQHRESVSQAMARIRQALAEPETCRQAPEVGAVCVKAHVRICAGGGEQSPSLPRRRRQPKLVQSSRRGTGPGKP
jgi:hypothetical protein